MGRSRRRMKKGKPKVQVGLPQKKRGVNKLPKAQTLILPNKEIVEWDQDGTLTSNYHAAGFVVDPNAGLLGASTDSEGKKQFGSDVGDLVPKGEEEPAEEPEELQVTLGKKRKAGALSPRYERLTRMQRTHIQKLMEKHGLDYLAMSRDMRLNRLQHTPGALKHLCTRYLAFEQSPARVEPQRS